MWHIYEIYEYNFFYWHSRLTCVKEAKNTKKKFSRISTVFNMTWRCECISMFLWHRKEKKMSFILAHTTKTRNGRKVRHSKNVFFCAKTSRKKQFFYISTWKWGSSTSHDRTGIKCLKNKTRTTYIYTGMYEKERSSHCLCMF